MAAPQQFDTIATQAAQARDADHLEDAIKLYHQALQLRPNWAEGWWFLGTLSYDRQQFPDAINALTKLIHLAPSDANAFAMLGLSEAKLHQQQPALTHLAEALKLNVGDEANMRHVVLFTQADLLLDDGVFSHAQQILDNLAIGQKDAPDDLLVALGRSVLGINTKPTPETSALLLTAGRAELLAANRETQPAMDAYSSLAKQFPKVHNVEFAYGRFLLNNHLDDQAVAAFKREIDNTPQHLLARLGIAGALLRTNPEEGRIYAAQAVNLAPKLEEPHYLLGASLLATEDPQHALSELEIAEQLNPKDPRVFFALASAYSHLHREADAARARQRFTELNAPH